MYKSPIETIYGELQTQMVQENENMVMKAIRKVGINVDKEELIKALQYDRNQYTKGYEDGKNDILDKIIAEIEETSMNITYHENYKVGGTWGLRKALEIIDKYKTEKEC